MRYLLFLMAAIAVTACNGTGLHGNGDDNYFSAYGNIEGDGWQYSRPVPVVVDTLRDSMAVGTLVLSVRHGADYRYSNIWLELSRSHRDSVVRRDTFDIILADDYGNWRGHGMGTSLQFTDTLCRNFTIHRSDTLMLRHIMRLDTLDGIERVGIMFIPDI